jgi:hypothetical protein
MIDDRLEAKGDYTEDLIEYKRDLNDLSGELDEEEAAPQEKEGMQ